MTTDITELAQREKFEAWVMTQICISKSTLEGLRTADGYRNSTLSGTNYNRMWDCWKAAGAELVEALEKAQQVDDELCKLLPPGVEYMDPPDGGDVTPLEGVRRMVADYRQRIAELESRTVTPVTYSENADADRCRKWAWERVKAEVSTEDWTTGDNITYFGFFCWGWDMRRQYNEQRPVTVKLPKPHAHLIWIQAGHAPDDFWDDVEVSHSEKDRCCDGSERYPVYARWEIEEMLAAAGIKVEAE